MEFLHARRTMAMAPMPDFRGDDELELSLELGIGRSALNSAAIAGSPNGAPDVGEKPKGGTFLGKVRILAEDQSPIEVKRTEARARDRSIREEEGEAIESGRAVGRKGLNGKASILPQIVSPNLSSNSAMYPGCHQQVQYVPVHNGMGMPYMVPCWAPTISPVAGAGAGLVVGFENVYCAQEQGMNAGQCVVSSAKADSMGSNSSGLSEHRSVGSFRGGSMSSSGSKSYSSWTVEQCKPEKHQPSQTAPCQTPVSSAGIFVKQTKSDGPSKEANGNGNGSVDNKSSALKCEEDAVSKGQLPEMPCVTATGDGPNGKTINGVLYRYTKSEVCIVCACHGTSFTPAEFVKHAGCTDSSHPLKQIVVVAT